MFLKYIALVLLTLTLIGPSWILVSGEVDLDADWRAADRSSASIAPDPADTPEALVLVYAARAFDWRGLFGVHMWIAVKPNSAEHYTVYDVVGWRAWRGLSVVSVRKDIPDRLWYSQRPQLVFALRGEQAASAIDKIAQASSDYSYQDSYSVWPGPNSNSYVAYIARQVPELDFVMPATAIGKDYLGNGKFLAPTPSGTGYQFSLYGLLGISLARKEGLEINILGAVFGVNPLTPAINLPGIGLINWEN